MGPRPPLTNISSGSVGYGHKCVYHVRLACKSIKRQINGSSTAKTYCLVNENYYDVVNCNIVINLFAFVTGGPNRWTRWPLQTNHFTEIQTQRHVNVIPTII